MKKTYDFTMRGFERQITIDLKSVTTARGSVGDDKQTQITICGGEPFWIKVDYDEFMKDWTAV